MKNLILSNKHNYYNNILKDVFYKYFDEASVFEVKEEDLVDTYIENYDYGVPSLVLSDTTDPKSLDGIKMCNPNATFILVASMGTPAEEIVKMIQHGAADFIRMPAPKNELEDKIRYWFEHLT